MTRTSSLFVALIATVGLPALVCAAGVATPSSDDDMRCEARQLQKQSNFFDCVARCGQLSGRAADTETRQADCRQKCQDRYDGAMKRLDERPPCFQPICVPVPEKCEARLLHTQAVEMMCLGRCKQKEQRDGTADPSCQSDCTTAYGTAKDEIMALCVCQSGRVAKEEAAAN